MRFILLAASQWRYLRILKKATSRRLKHPKYQRLFLTLTCPYSLFNPLSFVFFGILLEIPPTPDERRHLGTAPIACRMAKEPGLCSLTWKMVGKWLGMA